MLDTEKMKRYVNEEKQIREENLRLQRKLQLEVERREALCRHLSESESRLMSSYIYCMIIIRIFHNNLNLQFK